MNSGFSVVIAEDEAAIAMLAEAIVEDMGGRVLGVAATCDDALDLIEINPPNLVLLDARLAGSTGEAVAAAATARGISVLVSSGSDAADLPEALRQLPSVRKPWSFDEMQAALRSVLQARPA